MMKHYKDSNGGVHAYDDIQIAATVRAEHERKAIEAANEAAFQQSIDDAKATAKIEADAKAIELTEASEQALVDAEARHAEKATKIEQDIAIAIDETLPQRIEQSRDEIEAKTEAHIERLKAEKENPIPNLDEVITAINVALPQRIEQARDEIEADINALVQQLNAQKESIPSELAEEIAAINEALPKTIAQAANQIEAEAVDAAIKNFKPFEVVTFNEDAIQLEIAAKMAKYVGDKVEMSDAEYDAFVNPPKTIAQLIADKRAEINAAFNSTIQHITDGYPSTEIASWDKQEAEARAFVADANAATPLIDALALARGIDKAMLIERVIAKADLFAATSGQLIGYRQSLEDQLDVLAADSKTKAAAVEAVVWAV